MAATRLSLYNDALLLIGERAISSLSDEVESRRLLDQAWTSGAVDACLEEGQWHFARRTVLLDYDPAITYQFGYRYAFSKPDDFVHVLAVSADEYLKDPLLDYNDESGYIYCDLTQIYMSYVSNDASYGGDMSLWPNVFVDFVAAHLASKIAYKVGGDEALKVAASIRHDRLKKAKSLAAMSLPTSFPPTGRWNRSRRNGRTRGDGGNQNGPLIG